MKSIKYMINNIKKSSWYRQGGGINAVFLFGPILAMFHSIGKNNVFLVFKGSWTMDYFEKNEEKIRADKFLKEYIKNPKIIEERKKLWEQYLRKNMRLLQGIINLTDETQLNKLLKEHIEMTYKTWMPTMIIEYFDPWGEEYIQKYSSKYKLTADDIAALTGPEKYSYLQEEKIDRLNIVESKDMGRIKDHYERYYWYQGSWQHSPTLSVKYFEELIKRDMQNPAILRKEVEDFKKSLLQNKVRRDDIIKRYKIDEETQGVFKFFRELNDWRDIRKKELVCKVHCMLEQFLGRIAKINKLDRDILNHIYLPEIESFRLPKKYVQTLRKRAKDTYVMCFDENGEIAWFYGQDAKKIHNELDSKILESSEIKGMVAYNGIVKGKVKIIDHISDFRKMNEGDILVSIMTRPEMIPIMKKAAAIVTDEGGVTCHASIVSRELKVPCIVGTQIATSILKDGDMVEVDANRGIVTKL